jgi:hypothetical protein
VNPRLAVSLVVLFVACRKEPPAEVKPADAKAPAVAAVAPGPTPTEVTVAGAYHAVRCGEVTAVWTGSADDLKDLAVEGRPVPKSYGVKSLAFVFAGGRRHDFTPSGELSFSDWSFDVFSPDCSRAALLQDRYGPFTVLATKDLATFSNAKPFKAPGEPASVHGQWRWTGSSSFEFVASCCGGARVLAGDAAADKPLEQVFEVAAAPSGLVRGPKGWEVAK